MTRVVSCGRARRGRRGGGGGGTSGVHVGRRQHQHDGAGAALLVRASTLSMKLQPVFRCSSPSTLYTGGGRENTGDMSWYRRNGMVCFYPRILVLEMGRFPDCSFILSVPCVPAPPPCPGPQGPLHCSTRPSTPIHARVLTPSSYLRVVPRPWYTYYTGILSRLITPCAGILNRGPGRRPNT